MHYLRNDETKCGADGQAHVTLAAWLADPDACADCLDACLRDATITLAQWCEMPATAHRRRF